MGIKIKLKKIRMFQQLSENFEYVEELREKSHYQKIRNSMPDQLVNERFKK